MTTKNAAISDLPCCPQMGRKDRGSKSKVILNMTQHVASAEQKAAGVVDLPEAEAAELRRLLTFHKLPAEEQIRDRADAVADLALAYLLKIGDPAAIASGGGADIDRIRCMIGGAPFLMPALTRAMRSRGLAPVCAFSRRESVDEDQADGCVIKRSVFRPLGFVNLP